MLDDDILMAAVAAGYTTVEIWDEQDFAVIRKFAELIRRQALLEASEWFVDDGPCDRLAVEVLRRMAEESE